MVNDGLWCAFYNRHMALHGSEVADEFGFSRADQDEWALHSQLAACEAMKAGRLDDEIFPVEIREGKKTFVMSQDEGPRPETTIEGLAKLPPVFGHKSTVTGEPGSVTAGNAPGVNDGGDVCLLMSAEKAAELGIKPLCTILDYAEVSQPPKDIATVPGLAIRKILEQNDLTLDRIDLVEINEAFAAVVLVSARSILGMTKEEMFAKVNVNGSAIAYGHPIGATGARILMTLAYELRRRGGGLGVCGICSGAAQGDAMLIRVSKPLERRTEMQMRDVVIVSGARTAVGSFGGSLKGIGAVDLGALVIREAIRRAGLRPEVSAAVRACRPDVFREMDKTEIQKKYYDYPDTATPVYFDECIIGNVLQAGLGQNPGRQAGIYAGLPEETNAITVNKVCASGMKAIALAAQSIKAGDAEAVVAGGMENMSNVPFALPGRPLGVPDEHALRQDHGSGRLRRPLRDLQRLPHGVHGGEHRRPLRNHPRRSRMNWRCSATSGPAPPSRAAPSTTRSSRCRSPRRRGIPSSSGRTNGRWTPRSKRWPNSRRPSRRMAERSPPATPPGSTTGRRRSSSCPRTRPRNSA